MLDAALAAGIPTAIMEPAPWEAGTNVENQTLDALIAACKADILAHPGKNKFFPIRERIGETRGGGDPGNLWDFQSVYDSGDNLHPSPAGYQQMAEAAFGATG
jgi:lysophospholipase L1-like esterase